MSIDVVVPCYRYGRYLRQCVESVLVQDVTGLRVLILDDASPDDTPSVAEALAAADPRITYRRHATNRGHIATYNEGIDWAAADGMLLLSADDYLLPGALRRAVDLLEARPDVGLCFGAAIASMPDGRLERMAIGRRFECGAPVVLGGGAFVRLCIRAKAENIVPTPTAVVRTALLKRLGGYKPELPHSGDFELWLRLAAHAKVAVLPGELAVYRRHQENMSLDYTQDGHLADLRQRQAAFAALRDDCRGAGAHVERWHAALLAALARRALGHASAAFNADQRDTVARLQSFASGIHPGARRSLAWQVLRIKRLLGVRRVTRLLSRLAAVRATADGLATRLGEAGVWPFRKTSVAAPTALPPRAVR